MCTRNFKHITSQSAMALLVLGLGGCAATISNDGLEQRASAAIGREVGSFTIAKNGEETGGRINDTAKTKDSLTYQCYMYSVTKWDGPVRHLPQTASPQVPAIPC